MSAKVFARSEVGLNIWAIYRYSLAEMRSQATFATDSQKLRVGFLPTPDFTMLAFAGFVDTLRLAADDGDRSRPIRCSWEVMSNDRQPLFASCGVAVLPTSTFRDPREFDYLVVVGGTLHRGPPESPELVSYLKRAASQGVALIGVCTGSLVLARAGLMAGRRSCVSWFHYEDFRSEFPGLDVRADRLFIEDGLRITCAGGVSVIHLASYLVDRHCGKGRSDQGLRIMIEAGKHGADAAQPEPQLPRLAPAADPRVRRAMLHIERALREAVTLEEIAADAGASPRQLSRLFERDVGLTPGAYKLELRLHRARELVRGTSRAISDIAFECGFSDSSHLARSYRRRFGASPKEDRELEKLASTKPGPAWDDVAS